MTQKGRDKLPEFERVWTAGIASIKHLLSDTNAAEFPDLLETRIAGRDFRERTLKCVEPNREAEIIEFESRDARDFVNVNYDWLEEFFAIEEHDRQHLYKAQRYNIDAT